MEIAFIHPRYPDSDGTGSTHDATQIIDTLRDLGHEVVPYCCAPPPGDVEWVEVIDPGGVPPHTLTRLNRGVRARTSELSQFDVVHSYVPLLPSLNELARSATVVLTLESYKGLCPKMDLRYMDAERCRSNGTLKCTKCSILTSGGHADQGRLYRILSRMGDLRLINQVDPEEIRVDAFQAISPHVKDTFVEFGYPNDSIWVIPSILEEEFLVEHKSDFEPPFGLLYVGFLRESKGVQLLPAVVKRLDELADYDIHLTIVGDGPLRKKLKQQVRELGVADLVTFRGHVNHGDLPGIYAEHDLFVFPGLWEEPFGRVFMEAMAAGTPVVATNSGAARTIVGNAGKIVGSTTEELATEVHRAISDGELKKYAGNTRRQAERFRSESIGPQFDEMYEQVVRREPAVTGDP